MAKKKESRDACSIEDLEGIMEELLSPDEKIRAKAVSKVCPCRMGWEGYQRAMERVNSMQKDSSPLVRGAAHHIIEESYHMVSGSTPTRRQMLKNEMAAAKFRSRWR